MTAVTMSKAEIEALNPRCPRWDRLKDKLPEQITADDAAEEIPRSAAFIVALAAAPDAAWVVARSAEKEWQLQRLLDRLNNPNIPDWPLPEEKA